jgi:hypothetical protein
MYGILRRAGPPRPEPVISQNQRDARLHPFCVLAGDSGERVGGNRTAPAVRRAFLWRGADDGAAAVEAAVIVGGLLLAVFGSIEFGRAFWTYNTMVLAVEQAGRYAMVHAGGTVEVCRAQAAAGNCPEPSATPLANCSAARAREVLLSYWVGDIAIAVREDATSTPKTMTICASSSFGFLAPRLLPYGSLDLTSRVTVPLI